MPSSVLYGIHPVREVLRAGRRKVESLLYLQKDTRRLGDILALAEKMGVAVRAADVRELDRRAGSDNHQGVVAFVQPPSIFGLDDFIKRVKRGSERPVVVVMDSVVDPQNFGAILRSAETFGAGGAIYPKDRSADINSTVIKASAGATEHMDFCRVTNIARALEELRSEGFQILAAEADGEVRLQDFVPEFPLAVVMGSEGKGVRPLVRRNCDIVVRIPLRGKVESLNVNAAAAVIFYHIATCGGNPA